MSESMPRCAATLIAATALVAGNIAAASETELEQQILKQDGWVSYRVPMIAAAGVPCCYEFQDKRLMHAGCDLDGRNGFIGTMEHGPLPSDDTLVVYARVTSGRVDKLNAFAASCPVRDSDTVRKLDRVDAAGSVAWLAQEVLRDERFGDAADNELAALAMHAEAAATNALSRFATPEHPRKLREQALFWSGQMRGKAGAELAEHYATTDPDPEMRANAIFVLSESSSIDGYASIHRIAQTDASEHVREQALFWMAQTGDARAKNDIVAAIDTESSDKVREQAVFALSQLKDHADNALIALVRGNYPRKVKQQALFWLGESGSDEAMRFLDEVLTSSARSPHDG